MEVVDSAGVIKTKTTQKLRSQLVETESADDTCSEADEHGKSRSVYHEAWCPDDYTSSQGSIEKVFHLESSTHAQGTHHEGPKNATSKSEYGIDDYKMLFEGILSYKSEVEGRPIEPEEDGSDEGKYIG